MATQKKPMTLTEAKICRALLSGKQEDELIKDVWGVTKADKEKYKAAKKKYESIVDGDVFKEQYQMALTRLIYPAHAKAFNKIVQQIDDENGWVAQNAAREILNRADKLFDNGQNNTIRIEFGNMPEIGMPGEEDASDLG